MSRRRRAKKRELIPDSRYKSVLVSRLINTVMEQGKRSIAQTIVYQAFEYASELLGKGDPVDILLGALENTRPRLELKSRRVGGATYQVPIEIPLDRQLSVAFRALRDAARKKKGVPMFKALGQELKMAHNNENDSDAIKKKVEMHKMAQANKVFAHLKF